MKKGYTYILASFKKGTLYAGVTSNIKKRMWEHKNGMIKGFTKKYNVKRLVYYEIHDDIRSAIIREKQIKGWVRSKKIELIESENPYWSDLSSQWFIDSSASTLRSDASE